MEVLNSQRIRLVTLFCALVAGVVSLHSMSVLSALTTVAFYVLLIWNAIIDAYTKTLLVWVTNTAIVIALLHSVWLYHSDFTTWGSSLLWGLLICVPLILSSLLTGGRMLGVGDVRLLIALVCWHGTHILDALVIAIVAAGVVSLVGLVIRRLDRHATIPFGPT